MKTLDEKKKLAKFARGLGQPDLELEESIRREEELTARLFTESKKEPPIQILKEQLPPAPAPAVEVPKEEDLISQTMNVLSNPKFSKSAMPDLQAAEIKAIRQQIADLVQKMGTLSWGGGGTGVVRFFDLDDHQHPVDVKILSFNTAGPGPDYTPSPGSISWNPVEDCLNIYQTDGTTLQTGLEQYIRVRNITGNTINNGTLVQFAGVGDGSDLLVVPLMANSTFNPISTIGVLTEDIANNESGRATTFGKVRHIDTTGTPDGETWSLGNLLWADPIDTGRLTIVKPTAPNVAIPIAIVTKVDAADGEILVRELITPRAFYGDFVKTNSQTANDVNTPYVVELNKTEFASGFTLNANSEIVALESGLYDLSVTLNFSSSSASLVKFYHWIRVNGQNVPDSTVRNSLASNGGDSGTSSNHIVSLNAGDNVQIMWATEGTQVSLVAAANTTFAPSSPSVIVNIFQVAL